MCSPSTKSMAWTTAHMCLSVAGAGDKRAVAPTPPRGPIELTLDGGQRVEVRLDEGDGKPLEGLDVYPWLLRKPGEPDKLNLSYFVDLVQSTTNRDGVAEFPWIPSWPVTFWPRSDEHAHVRGNYDPKSGNATVTMTFERLVPLRGRVTLPDGSPAAGIEVTANGAGFSFDDFSRHGNDRPGRSVRNLGSAEHGLSGDRARGDVGGRSADGICRDAGRR
jgi:hypothetical protein